MTKSVAVVGRNYVKHRNFVSWSNVEYVSFGGSEEIWSVRP